MIIPERDNAVSASATTPMAIRRPPFRRAFRLTPAILKTPISHASALDFSFTERVWVRICMHQLPQLQRGFESVRGRQRTLRGA